MISIWGNLVHKYLVTEIQRSLVLGLAGLAALFLLDTGDTTLADDDVLEDDVQLAVLADGGDDVVGHDTLGGLLVLVLVGFTEDLVDDGFEDGSHVNWGIRGDTVRIAALLQVAVDTTDGEDDSCTGGSGFGFLVSCHLICSCRVERKVLEVAMSRR